MTNDPKASTAVRPALIGSLVAAVALLIFSVVPVLANPVPTNPDPPRECPDAYGSGLITHYVTTLNMPADSNDWWVSVQFTLADEDGQAANCQLSLATYELPTPAFMFPQTLHAQQTGTFGAGTHTLTADLPVPGTMPDCFFQFDFVFGPAIDQLVFEDRYGDRQIRSRIEPSSAAACPVIAPVPPTIPPSTPPSIAPASNPPSVAPAVSTPSPAARGNVGGSQGGPAAGVPNTSSFVGEPTSATAFGILGSLLLVGSMGGLFAISTVRARSKD